MKLRINLINHYLLDFQWGWVLLSTAHVGDHRVILQTLGDVVGVLNQGHALRHSDIPLFEADGREFEGVARPKFHLLSSCPSSDSSRQSREDSSRVILIWDLFLFGILFDFEFSHQVASRMGSMASICPFSGWLSKRALRFEASLPQP